MAFYDDSLALHPFAHRVLALTAHAWNVGSLSPQAIARRAPRGYVPMRVRRRMKYVACLPNEPHALLDYSW